MDIDAVAARIKLAPYRQDVTGADSASVNCLHFNVAQSDDWAELATAIGAFLRAHAADLQSLSAVAKIDFRTLDIGLAFAEEKASASVELGHSLLAQAAQLGLSISLSFYRTTS